ncbi:hypothetical protein KA005_44730, partial [bacterium]|nr:hypothetical protein [bacterium]
MKNLFSISLVYRKYWKNFLLILSLIFLGSATGIAFPFGIRYLFNHIVVQKALHVIPLFLLIMILIFILRAISTVYKEKLSSTLANTIITDIREKLFQKGLTANIELIEKKGASQLSSLLLSDIQSLDDMIQNGFLLGISSLIMSFIFLSALLFIHLPLAIVSFAAVLPFLYFFMRLHNAIKSKAIKTRRVTARLNAFFTETMSILSTI